MGCGKAEIWSLKKFKPSLSVKTLCMSHEADVRQTTDTIRTQRSRRRRFAQKQTIESVNMKYCVSDLSERGKAEAERAEELLCADRQKLCCLSLCYQTHAYFSQTLSAVLLISHQNSRRVWFITGKELKLLGENQLNSTTVHKSVLEFLNAHRLLLQQQQQQKSNCNHHCNQKQKQQ